MIEIKKYTELLEQTKDKLEAYIKSEFGHIPFVNELEWAVPDWTIIYYEDDKIASFYNVVLREIVVDKQMLKVGGINNVITPKDFRGKGYASKILRETDNLIFNDLNCDLGVLLCADNLIPFYERLNWYKVDCPVYFDQSSGEKLWSANTMLLTKNDQLKPKRIELNGLPW